MLFLAIPTLRKRWGSFLGVFATVAAAVTLMTAMGSLLEAGVRGAVPPERLTGSQIVVAADQSITEIRGSGEDRETISSDGTERVRLPVDLAAEIAAVPGVGNVRPEWSFAAVLVGTDGTQLGGPLGGAGLGHAWSSAGITPFVLTSGRPPIDDRDVVVDTGLARRAGITVDNKVRVIAAGKTLDVTVVGLTAPQSGWSLRQQSAIFFADQTAERLYGHTDEADLFGVDIVDGADASAVYDALRAVLGERVSVFVGNERGRAEFLDAGESSIRLIAISGSIGGIGMFVAMLVIAGMLSLFVQQRQREVALLRALGATPRQVRRMISREVMVITVAGAVLGVWPGSWLAARLADAMQTRGLLPGTFETRPGAIPAIVAVAAAVLASQVAANFAGRRAGKVRPVEALADAAVPTSRLGIMRGIMGAIAIAGTATLFMTTASVRGSLAPAVALGLFAVAVMATGLLAPLLMRIGLRVLTPAIRCTSGVGGFLAVANTRSQARRLASAVTPLALTVGIAGMTLFQQATLDHETQTQSDHRLVADHVIDTGAAGVRFDAIDDLRVDGFNTVIGLAQTTVFANYELDPYLAVTATPGRLGDVLDLGLVDGSVTDLGTDEVMVSADAAASMGAQLGDHVEIHLGDGFAVSPIVVAVYERSSGFADIVLPWHLTDAHRTDPSISLILVDDIGNADAARSTLARFERDHPGSRVGGREVVQAAEDANSDTQAWVGYVLLGLVVVFCTFAVVNTLMLAIGERGREFALLRLVGGTRRQVIGMMALEASMVVITGLWLGAALAATTVMPVAKAVTGSYRPQLPMPFLVGIAVTAALIGLVGTMLPTFNRLRSRPAQAIGVRE